jgi:hypothetical protein
MKIKHCNTLNSDCIVLKLSTKVLKTLEFVIKKSVHLNMASLAFTTQVILGSHVFPGLIQYL